jgi:hypothetical protein
MDGAASNLDKAIFVRRSKRTLEPFWYLSHASSPTFASIVLIEA